MLGTVLDCGEGYHYIPYGENISIPVCPSALGDFQISPSLPEGISYKNGILFGSTVVSTNMRRYTIHNETSFGTFWVEGSILFLHI